MPTLDPTDPRKVPERPTVTSFCDRCHELTRVTQVKTIRGVNWLCASCSPAVTAVPALPHSAPPPDAAPSPLLDQWIDRPEPEPHPPELNADLEEEYLAYLASQTPAEPIHPEHPGGGEP